VSLFKLDLCQKTEETFMTISTETRSFCEICQRIVFVAFTSHSTKIAVCDYCLKEFETYKLQFPKATLNEFTVAKRTI